MRTSDSFTAVDKEFEFDTVQQARDAAMDDATSSGGRVYPCLVFQQGGRVMITTSFPFTFLSRQVRLDPATKGGNPRLATNRPLMPDHVRTIRQYLLNNPREYILPPVTLNVRQMPQVYVQKSNAPMRSGFLVVSDSTMFDVTDGQHRIAAIAGTPATKPPIPPITAEAPEFELDGMSVLIVVEDDMLRIHQDFADAAQTKQIPASLLAAYNTREPVNRVLTRIVDENSLFSGRVDETSKTLPKLSQSVFLLNQVRGLVKELLIGDYAMAEPALAKYALKQLGTPEQQEAFVTRTNALLRTLTENMEPWRTIVQISTSDTRASQIPEFRQQYVNMTATGLVIIGRVAYEIQKWLPEEDRLSKYRELATKIDWRRDADIWKGAILIDGKLLTNRKPISTAVERVKEALDLSVSLVSTAA